MILISFHHIPRSVYDALPFPEDEGLDGETRWKTLVLVTDNTQLTFFRPRDDDADAAPALDEVRGAAADSAPGSRHDNLRFLHAGASGPC